jgi:UDP-N-acetylmuramate--alanine ligase
VRNAVGALAAIHRAGHDPVEASTHLPQFSGTSRRFDVHGEFNGVTLIDDYAHHPTEIRSTLNAARQKYQDHKIIAVWQPHTFTRSKVFFNEFTQAFSAANEVIVTEVYAAREEDAHFSARSLADQIENAPARFIANLDDVIKFLISYLKSTDVLLVLSAGDAVMINEKLVAHYAALPNVPNKRQPVGSM